MKQMPTFFVYHHFCELPNTLHLLNLFFFYYPLIFFLGCITRSRRLCRCSKHSRLIPSGQIPSIW